MPVAVVGVGASAGGLEALRLFVANLPEDSPFAFVVAQHLSPTHQSMLVPLLARETILPVSEIAQGQEPERGHVYVTPARCNVLLGDGRLQLTEALEPGHPRPSVDEFFVSLAGTMADRAIGIALSGTGSDGARGIRAIRGAGGLTLAQDEGSARYGGMPRAAIDTGCVDHVLSPDQMVLRLSDLAMPGGGAHRAPELPEATRSIDRIYSLVRARTGTDLDSYKDTTVQRRLRRRMSACSVNSVEEYERLLLDNPEEVLRLAREVLISVTSFFRDTEPFLAPEQFVAEVVARKSEGEEVRVWVPGCATGEEPYSIAMLFAAALDAARKDLRVQVFATDVDHQALARARRGLYPAK